MGWLGRLFGGGDSAELAALIDEAMARVVALTAAHVGLFHIDEASWSVDQDLGTIFFTSAPGLRATAPVQIIGSYDTLDGTWLWGWDHPSVVPALATGAAAVRDYGAAHRIAELTTRKLRCTEDRAWQLTAGACALNQAQGAYRGPSGSTRVFMTFGEVVLDQAP